MSDLDQGLVVTGCMLVCFFAGWALGAVLCCWGDDAEEGW